jgi:arsenate reductase
MKLRVLFLCTGNSCRSQIAEGFLRHFGGDQFDVASAGTHPAGLNPDAVEAMREIGIDISHHRSKAIGEVIGQRFDHVITVCDRAKESCPIFPEATCVHHWPFDDPATAKGSPEERKAVFRRVRDEIAARVQRFLDGTD